MIREHEVVAPPSTSAWLKADPVRDPVALAALRREWDELLEASDAGLFNAWEWMFPWTQRIGAERALSLWTVRDRGGTLVGVLPFTVETRRVWGRPIRRMAFAADSHVGSDYLDVVARRGAEADVRAVCLSTLLGAEAEWDVLDLLDLDAESPTVDLFATELGRRGLCVERRERFICPYERFGADETFDEFLRKTGRRDNYLRRKKWLEKQPGYRIERAETPSELPRAMAEFFRLHRLRWAGEGGSQGIRGERVEAFHRDATQLLAECGKTRLYTMWVGDKAVASVYGLVDRGRFIYFQSGYDPDWRNKSVGLVLVGETFKDSLEEGLREYDFLRGTETYKSDWTTQTRRTVALRAYRPTGVGRWLSETERAGGAARAIAKRVLPSEIVERVRRIRRARSHVR